MSGTPAWLAAGQGGTPLVLLHGMGSTASVWLPQLEHFGRHRQTVAWTMPGYGASSPLHELTWAALADALDALRAALGVARMHLLGHSIGGMVAQEYAHRHPQRLASLILSSTSAGFGNPGREWQQEFVRLRSEPLQAAASFGEAAPALLRNFVGPHIDAQHLSLAELSARGVDRDRYVDCMRLLTTFDRADDLERIAAPTLLIAGDLDRQAPLKAMQKMAVRIPHARLVCLEQTNHMANLEVPDTFNRTVDEFLSAVEAN